MHIASESEQLPAGICEVCQSYKHAVRRPAENDHLPDNQPISDTLWEHLASRPPDTPITGHHHHTKHQSLDSFTTPLNYI